MASAQAVVLLWTFGLTANMPGSKAVRSFPLPGHA
ncbi:hypothetical protein Dret_1925 [Desulfohalobium retbaense DSM 5692]|uniref:Uncharacterized protein n=1 Tax=Desulfohalobium retbaense (strain ATCC 49708 / DSM 5692 / JCM 16813 / HR100) TaxID=485915 RepID=C8X4I6_DESRD|nr:hypothetical protein Dret_1925 [Desulfohalobium retbaense DSM 5692]